MTTVLTPNKGLSKQATGDNVDAWGPILNGNFDAVDAALGGKLALTLSNAGVTLSPTQAQNVLYVLSGTITTNIPIVFPDAVGFVFVQNKTTGSFAVSISTSAVETVPVIVPQGATNLFVCDGISFAPMNVSTGTVVTPALTTWNSGDAEPSVSLSTDQLTISRITSSGNYTGSLACYNARSTTSKNSGKWYFEAVDVSSGTTNTTNGQVGIGLATSAAPISQFTNGTYYGGNQVLLYGGNGAFSGTSTLSGLPTWARNSVRGFAVDADARVASVYSNGTLIAANQPLPLNAPLFVMGLLRGGELQSVPAIRVNFGNSAFAQAIPAGYSAWG